MRIVTVARMGMNYVLERRVRDGFTYIRSRPTGGPTIEPHFADDILVPGDLFVDIGGNIGGWAIPASLCYREVCSFEPTPEILSLFRRNVAMNHRHNIRIFPCALGESDGEATLYTGPLLGQNSLITGHLDRITTGKVIVPVRKLDDFHLKPSLVKIDTEGYEVPILKGGLETISKYRPRLLIETHGNLMMEPVNDAMKIKHLLPDYHWIEFMKGGQIFMKGS
jgi:FkbM family methyltransferase